MPEPDLKPTHKAIQRYYAALADFAALDQSHESGTRSAFLRLLEDTAHLHDWVAVAEVGQKVEGRTIRPDATLYKSAVPRGYWEAKDTADDLNAEITKKIKKGYPLNNIIFEDTRAGVLYQNKQETFRADLRQPDQLAHLLNLFFAYTEPVLERYDQALDHFSDQLPRLSDGLKHIVADAHKHNLTFQSAYQSLFELCQTSLNPAITTSEVDEMLVQHLLTERLIRKIFDNPDFTRRNVIAAEIEKVITALVSRSFNRDEYLQGLDTYYQAIESAAHGLDFSQKQHILNEVYERFFQGYSTKTADTHGIVYTPQPIVDFMCASVVEALQTEFGKSLGDPDVVILDPCTGTGNFIVNLLRRAPQTALPDLYRERLFANEIMLLPYYVAALNIEHAYYDLTGRREYIPFEGLCFVDTLSLKHGMQYQLTGMTEDNRKRIQRQGESPITVILGNPPYNVGQKSENDNNKNRRYLDKQGVDTRIKTTYAKDSAATNKNALSDAYVKFFRWASDRLQGRDGIVCYVTNNSFVDQLAFDGMRKHLLQDFTRIYHLDLHGNIRQNPKLSGTTHNVFGIQVGVGVTVAIRSAAHTARRVYYHRVPEDWRKEEKLGWLTERTPNPLPLPPISGEGVEVKPVPPISGEGEKIRPVSPTEGGKEGEWNPATWQTDGKLWGKLGPLARENRNNPTFAEDALWQRIRRNQLGPKFRRQFSIERFIVDFYSSDAKLVIEVDGEIHQYTALEDEIRQRFLEDQGLRVLRFTNDEVLTDIDQVLTRIQSALHTSTPSPEIGGTGLTSTPSPEIGGTGLTSTPSPEIGGRGRGLGVNLDKSIPWTPLTPDSRHTWLVPQHADQFAVYVPLGSKSDRAASGDGDAIFKLYSLGVSTHRDSIVYDFHPEPLIERVQTFIEDYNAEVDRYKRAKRPADLDEFVKYERIKWSETLKGFLKRGEYAEYDVSKVRNALYRPFCKQHLYFDAILNERRYQFPQILPTPAAEAENRVICLSGPGHDVFYCLIANTVVDLKYSNAANGGSQCFPFYTYDPDGSNRTENIPDSALARFQTHYGDRTLTKWDLFYYAYGLLHHPDYRTRFKDNLKKELPRLPFAPDFRAFARVGRALADLHLNYESAALHPLQFLTQKDTPLSYRVEKMRLSKDKTSLVVNDSLTLGGIPAASFDYRLGSRSALDWVIDQYQVSRDKEGVITSDPNRPDDPRYIVDLVARIITLSLETQRLIGTLPAPF